MAKPDNIIVLPSGIDHARREEGSHPPPPPPGSARSHEILDPSLRWMRGAMVREFVRRLRRKQRAEARPPRTRALQAKVPRARRRKRKAALALGASVMGMGTAAADFRPPVTTDAASHKLLDPTQTRVDPAMISASETLKEALAEEEGVRLTVYRDVAGYPTVGVGHLVQPRDGLRVGDRISYEEAIDFLERDLRTAEKAVRRLVGDLKLFQHEFDALVDLVYNVGEGNVSDRRSPRLNAAILAADYDTIAEELHYYHAGGRKARGLVYRSERREAIFLDASYDDPRPSPVSSDGKVSA